MHIILLCNVGFPLNSLTLRFGVTIAYQNDLSTVNSPAYLIQQLLYACLGNKHYAVSSLNTMTYTAIRMILLVEVVSRGVRRR